MTRRHGDGDLEGGAESKEELLHALYRETAPLLRRFFVRRGASTEEAADLTQDTFLRAFRGFDAFRGDDAQFRRWLFQIAANVWLNNLRQRHAAKRSGIELSVEQLMADDDPSRETEYQLELGVDADLLLAARTPQAIDQVLRREQIDLLSEELKRLPPRMRQSLLLRLSGLKYHEIASVLGISSVSVKAHLHLATRRLKLALGEAPGGDT